MQPKGDNNITIKETERVGQVEVPLNVIFLLQDGSWVKVVAPNKQKCMKLNKAWLIYIFENKTTKKDFIYLKKNSKTNREVALTNDIVFLDKKDNYVSIKCKQYPNFPILILTPHTFL